MLPVKLGLQETERCLSRSGITRQLAGPLLVNPHEKFTFLRDPLRSQLLRFRGVQIAHAAFVALRVAETGRAGLQLVVFGFFEKTWSV